MVKLEIGCGGKSYEFRPKICPRCDILGDVETPNVRLPLFVRLDAQDLPFQPNVFDEVYLSHALEHLENPIQCLKEIHRVLKGSGKIHVWVPNFMDASSTDDPTHRQIFNFYTLKKLLKRCGFKTYIPFGAIGTRLPFRRLFRLLHLLTCAELYVVGEKA